MNSISITNERKTRSGQCRHVFIVGLVLFTVTCLCLNAALAAILFQDNFDSSPDWQSGQTVHKSQEGGYDISWPMTRADTCSSHCPPPGWTSYRAASSLWTDSRGQDTWVLSSEGARGDQGKGITYNVEVSGDYGVWTGGSLDIWLGDTGYQELFIRFYLRYDPGWQWTDPDQQNHSQQKLLRISTFNDNIWTSGYNPHQYGSASVNWPVLIPDWYYNSSFPPARLTMAVRKAPDYSTDETETVRNTAWPTDAAWHCYEFRVRMNSAPGVADGVWEVWIDGVSMGKRTDVVWKKDASDPDRGWNWIMLLDNITNASAPRESHTEMKLYLDDVVVSTEYIGPEEETVRTRVLTLEPPSFTHPPNQ